MLLPAIETSNVGILFLVRRTSGYRVTLGYAIRVLSITMLALSESLAMSNRITTTRSSSTPTLDIATCRLLAVDSEASSDRAVLETRAEFFLLRCGRSSLSDWRRSTEQGKE